MVIDKTGHVKNNLYYLGVTECPIFLLDGPQPVIFDAGVTCTGKIYVEAIRSILGKRQPSALLLTHVHWDHCGSAAYLKKAFPDMKIAATSMAANILQRPNALALISNLNGSIAAHLKSLTELDPSQLLDERFNPFEIDILLNDNEVFDFGGGNIIKVLSTPGHTQDHHSFYLPNDKILIAGEAAGVYYSPEIASTEFVSSYDAYMSSLLRLAEIPAEIFCQGHYYILVGREEISAFFERSIKETISFKDRTLGLLREENGSVEKVMSRLKTERFDMIPSPKQPETAYLLNLKAQVTSLAAMAGS
jgi:glyoxylase-like metal-dependent hydrolase (beta-lactamase superfamily II)